MISSDVICDVRYVMLCYVHFNQNFSDQTPSDSAAKIEAFSICRGSSANAATTALFPTFLQRRGTRSLKFFMPFFLHLVWRGRHCDGGERSQTKEQFKIMKLEDETFWDCDAEPPMAASKPWVLFVSLLWGLVNLEGWSPGWAKREPLMPKMP